MSRPCKSTLCPSTPSGFAWGSIREIEVSDGELSAPPTEAWEKVKDDASGDFGFDMLWGIDMTGV